MEAVCSSRRGEPVLPPGFRFHPTDEELIECYLIKKVQNNNFSVRAIGDVDLNKNEPWELPDKAKMGEKEWYFFTLRDRKYPTGMRTNRATEAGYWKATGKDRDINKTGTSSLVGAKKTLVFYRGRAPKGVKTNWIMHEYRLEGEAAYLHSSKTSKDSEWVVCRIFQKSPGGKKGGLYNGSNNASVVTAAATKESHKESFNNNNKGGGGSTSNVCEHSDGHSSLPALLESPHLDNSPDSLSMLKHIPSATAGSCTNFIKFPFVSYDHHLQQPFYEDHGMKPPSLEDVHHGSSTRCLNLPHGIAASSCKMEPPSAASYQQHQHHHSLAQQQVYSFSRPREQWNPEVFGLQNGPAATEVPPPPGLADMIESAAPGASFFQTLPPSSSGVDLESLWNY